MADKKNSLLILGMGNPILSDDGIGLVITATERALETLPKEEQSSHQRDKERSRRGVASRQVREALILLVVHLNKWASVPR